jgi:ubiquinone/menaquinone biosynthesis C-methylase UbiE
MPEEPTKRIREVTVSGTHPYAMGVSGFDQTFGMPMRQFIPTLLRLAQLAPSQRVLDIATGTGMAAEAALAVVGASGHVTAADDTDVMLQRARERLAGRPNGAFAAERAEALGFPDGGFDVVLCSMALMIFPDRMRALRQFHRVLRDGGRLAVSINTRPERSLTGRVRKAVSRHVPSMQVSMACHYSLSDTDRLRDLLQTAGFRDVETLVETRYFSFPSFSVYFEPFEQGGGPWGAAYAALPAATRRTIREEVQRGLTGDITRDAPITIGVDIAFGSARK